MNPRVDAEWLAVQLVRPGSVWTAVTTVATTGSTNADLAAAARDGAESGQVLVSDHQSAGRGRFTRVWHAPPGTSLAISVLLRPPPGAPVNRWSWLPLLTGVAVARALTEVAGVTAALKWPNDVLVEADGGRWCKVSGVLAQVVPTPSGAGVVVGVGLNVLQRADELPLPTAASLATVGAASTDRDTVLRAVLRTWGDLLTTWRAGGGDPDASGLAAAYRGVCRTLGREVEVHLPDGTVLAGRATSVDDDGRLLVQPADGSPARALAAGDVVHVR